MELLDLHRWLGLSHADDSKSVLRKNQIKSKFSLLKRKCPTERPGSSDHFASPDALVAVWRLLIGPILLLIWMMKVVGSFCAWEDERA